MSIDTYATLIESRELITGLLKPIWPKMISLILQFLRKIRKIWRVITRQYFTFRVRLLCREAGAGLTVNYWSTVTSTTTLGSNVHFNGMVIDGLGTVRIGNNFHSGSGILILTQNHKYDGANAIPYDTDQYVYKNVTIEENVWIGSRVIILGGVTIGEGAIVQAGAVVVKDIPKFAIAGGNPAKPFKTRNIQEYQKLKLENRIN